MDYNTLSQFTVEPVNYLMDEFNHKSADIPEKGLHALEEIKNLANAGIGVRHLKDELDRTQCYKPILHGL